MKLVAKGGKGWLGYWLHPGEPADRPWRLVELDTEFSFWRPAGRTLAEGAAADRAAYQGEPDERIAFARLAADLTALGLPLSTRDYDALDDTEYVVDPERLMDELTEAAREKHGLG
ncbi:hypothetical protein ABT097_28805 [Streptomyces sp. NPDC002225]|uniref:hypothetical protein n=1 Tax=Streptomyces sp. NPDC002225 TaxID=3154413 RepID=UPI0033177ACD